MYPINYAHCFVVLCCVVVIPSPPVYVCDLFTHRPYWGGGDWVNFLLSAIFSGFQNYQNWCSPLNITFISGRCDCSYAAVTPARYERDCTDLTDTFAQSKTPQTEKLTNGALVSPTAEPRQKLQCSNRVHILGMCPIVGHGNTIFWVKRAIYITVFFCTSPDKPTV